MKSLSIIVSILCIATSYAYSTEAPQSLEEKNIMLNAPTSIIDFADKAISAALIKDLEREHTLHAFTYNEQKRRENRSLLRKYKMQYIGAFGWKSGKTFSNSAYKKSSNFLIKTHLDDIYVTSNGNDVCAFDMGSKTLTWKGHTDLVNCCTAVPHDPDIVVSGSQDQTIKIWNLNTDQVIQTLHATKPVKHLAAENNYVCSGTAHCLKLWDLAAARCMQTQKLDVKDYMVSSLMLRNSIMHVGLLGTIKTYDARFNKAANEWSAHSYRIIQCITACKKDDFSFFSASEGNSIIQWDIRNLKTPYKTLLKQLAGTSFTPEEYDIKNIYESHDGRQLFASDMERVYVCNLVQEELVCSNVATTPIRSVLNVNTPILVNTLNSMALNSYENLLYIVTTDGIKCIHPQDTFDTLTKQFNQRLIP